MYIMENKVSFISGFVLTSLWTMPLYEIGMAFVLGLVGGLGGLIGRVIFKKLEKWLNKE
jgi:hypothetical protein